MYNDDEKKFIIAMLSLILLIGILNMVIIIFGQ